MAATPRAALLVFGLAVTTGCAVRPGGVPMAGHRDRSTACVFGLRGVRIALDDATPRAIDVRLTMCSDLSALRQRARTFIDAQGSRKASASNLDVREVELAHQHASAHVEDIAEGVRIVVVPDVGSDPFAIRDEVEARVERAASDNRCD